MKQQLSMKSFEDYQLAKCLLDEIEKKVTRSLNIMQVCGTHTRSVYKYGIDKLLPEEINLISGPGCPVCVTPVSYIDEAIELSKNPRIIIATFGDLMKIPGSECKSLSKQRAAGGNIEVIYSPMDTLKLANENLNKEIVFLGVGFETTTPAIALMLKEAKKKQIENISVLLAIKTMPKVMEKLLKDKEIEINGFICPGHVATIIGIKEFDALARKYKIPMVVGGFQSVDILGGILTVVNDVNNRKYGCENRYSRAVRDEGNIVATKAVSEVFEVSNAFWRGLGTIHNSGLKLRKEYEQFDAKLRYKFKIVDEIDSSECICGEILKGKKVPNQCRLYGVKCTPHSPVGACMVSSEGACGIAYEFER